jgi:homocitrate synthase NifV
MTVRGLVDTTLREGAQAPAPYLSMAQKTAVLGALGRIGVAEIELGPAVSEPAFRPEPLSLLLAAAAELAPEARRAVWCRARPDDIKAAAALGPEVVSFALPVSDRHLVKRLQRDRAWALDQLHSLVVTARDAGVGYVSVGLEDATRADAGFLLEVAATAEQAGADRLRIADTVGVATPMHVSALLAAVKPVFGGELGVHLHDDFGMATAGAVVALASGAAWADVSLLGLGERAGISRLEEVCGWLTLQGDSDYDLLAVCDITRLLAAWVGRPVPPHSPVIGSDIFTSESGLHVAGIVADPATYEPYPPEAVGAQRSLRLGQNSGRAAVAALVPEAGNDLIAVTARVRTAAAGQSRSLDPSVVGPLTTAATGP